MDKLDLEFRAEIERVTFMMVKHRRTSQRLSVIYKMLLAFCLIVSGGEIIAIVQSSAAEAHRLLASIIASILLAANLIIWIVGAKKIKSAWKTSFTDLISSGKRVFIARLRMEGRI